MGSHGGATAEGQRDMLAGMGITEDTVGAPIRASMETVEIGVSANGFPVHLDRFAAEADGIIVVNRIKPHVAFRGPCESGLMKMIVIGMGKQKGADTCHELGFGTMAENLPVHGPGDARQGQHPLRRGAAGERLPRNRAGRGDRPGRDPGARAGAARGGLAALPQALLRAPGRADHRRDRQGHQRHRLRHERGRPLPHARTSAAGRRSRASPASTSPSVRTATPTAWGSSTSRRGGPSTSSTSTTPTRTRSPPRCRRASRSRWC